MKNIFSIFIVFNLLSHQIVQANEQSIIQYAFAQSIWTQLDLPSQISTRDELQQFANKIKSPELKKLVTQDFSKVRNKFEPIKISTKMHQVWINDLVIDFKTHSITYKKNIYKFDLHNIDYEGLKKFIQSHEKKKTSFLNYIISDAHADFGFSAVIAIFAVVMFDTIISAISSKKCENKYFEILKSTRHLTNTCQFDLTSLQDGSPRDILETSIFATNLKNPLLQPHDKHKSAPSCAHALQAEFRSWDMVGMVTCITPFQTATICDEIKLLDICLNSFEKFDASRMENTGRNTIHDDERISPQESSENSSER